MDGNVGLPEVLTCYYDNLRGSIDFGNVGNCQGLISSTKSLGENTSLSIRIVPNPVVNTLHIATNALSNIKSFKIFDLIGHEYINVQNYDSQEINAGNLPSGMYIVVLKMSDNSYYSTKFAKIQ